MTNALLSIRPLFTDDIRRRRVSGRHQISNDGKHLIDGIAFGRPLLKAPRGRPNLDIPPRKRRRIGFEDEELDIDGDVDEEADEEDADADYEHPEEEREPLLLLTNGEEQHERRRKSVRIAVDFDNGDLDDDIGEGAASVRDGGEVDNEEHIDQPLEQDSSDSDEDDEMEYTPLDYEEDDLEKELEDLQNDNLEDDDELGQYHQDVEQAAETVEEESLRPHMQQDLSTEINSTTRKVEKKRPSSDSHRSPEGLDKMVLLRTAFPAAPAQVCREVLTAEGGELKRSYLTLLQAFKPDVPETEILKRWRSHNWRGSAQGTPSSHTPVVPSAKVQDTDIGGDDGDDGEDQSDGSEGSGDDDVTTFIRRFDRQGLPPGTIGSGNALGAMAAISNSFTNGKATSQIPAGSRHSFFEEADNDNADDTTSSGGSSSSSEDEGEAQENESSGSSSSDDEDGGDGDSGTYDDMNERPDVGGSHSSSDDDSSDSDSDSAPEEQSTKFDTASKQRKTAVAGTIAGSSDISPSSSSSDDSDADDETSSSDESSEDDSGDSDSSSDSESEDVVAHQSVHGGSKTAVPTVISADALQNQSTSTTQYTGIPGSGKQATKSRNIRRRLAKKFQSEAARALPSVVTHPIASITPKVPLAAEPAVQPEQPTEISQSAEKSQAEKDKELFEAKRQALLDALANGGIEVGPDNQLGLEDSQVSNKRKRAACDTANDDSNTPISLHEAPSGVAATEDDSPTSAQKRRRLDLGAGRRMLFGALGLRNPKSKDDEDKLRNKLMKDVKPLQNARLADEHTKVKALGDEQQESTSTPRVDEDPDSWRNKIIYRAVECVQENVELSEPPFPFVQRWDPQQQNNWSHKHNKRGGRGKRTERNQSHFYQDDHDHGEKTLHDESQDWDESYLNGTFQSAQKTSHYAGELNYDDVEQAEASNDGDEAKHLPDVDDLPSLPEKLEDLQPLRPREAQTGMVITWKQFILSSATNWQPQVLNLTGVICRIDDDATGFEVMLAKRDRDLEQPEKQYDNNTGRRIYDKFEAPDVDEEDEEEDEETKRANEGYRTLSFDVMQDPRILQPAIPLEVPMGHPTLPSIEDDAAVSTVEAEVTTDARDTTFEGFDDSIQARQASEMMEISIDNHETAKETSEATQSFKSAQNQEAFIEGTAEISSSNHPLHGTQSANFSVSDLAQVSSPLRLSHDETISVLGDISADAKLPAGPYDDTFPLVAESGSVLIASNPANDHNEFSMQIDDDDVCTGTPKFNVTKHNRSPSYSGSVHSGRQLDLTMEMGLDQTHSFRATTEGSAEQDGEHENGFPPVLGDNTTSLSEDCEDTPRPSLEGGKTDTTEVDNITPTPSSLQLQQAHQATPGRQSPECKDIPAKRSIAESNPSTPGSLASLGTVWCTAVASQNTRSPSKSRQRSAPRSQNSVDSNKDVDYEEAMRQLDNFSEDDSISGSVSKISDSFKARSQSFIENPMHSPSFAGAANDESAMIGSSVSGRTSFLPPRIRTDVKISPPPTSRSRSRPRASEVDLTSPLLKQSDSSPEPRVKQSNRTSQSKLFIPPGTQVLENNSDSNEPRFVEHYADDDKDESYSPASLPKGSGWVKKSRPARSSTAPLTTQKKASSTKRAVSSSQNSNGSLSRNVESAAAAMKRINKNRNTSARL